MERKVLIAIDGSNQSLRAVRYVGRTFGPVRGFGADLLHLIKGPPPFLVQESRTDPHALARLKTLQSKIRRQAEDYLTQAKEEAVRSGIAEENVTLRQVEIKTGLAKDIVFEAQNGLYDALVLGRRGLGRVQEMFMGSVSSQCVELAKSVPVWLVDGQVESNKVLLALDGSEDSFRAVDHVGFILARHSEMETTLVHVSTSLAAYCSLEEDEELAKIQEELLKKEEDYCLTNYFGRAIKMLTEAGVERSRIQVNFIPKSVELARTILKEARLQGDCPYHPVIGGEEGADHLPVGRKRGADKRQVRLIG